MTKWYEGDNNPFEDIKTMKKLIKEKCYAPYLCKVLMDKNGNIIKILDVK